MFCFDFFLVLGFFFRERIFAANVRQVSRMSIFGPKCGHCQNQYVFWKRRDFPRILLQLKQTSIVWLYFFSIGYCITSLILLHQTKTLRMCKRERECLIECVNECRIVDCGPNCCHRALPLFSDAQSYRICHHLIWLIASLTLRSLNMWRYKMGAREGSSSSSNSP